MRECHITVPRSKLTHGIFVALLVIAGCSTTTDSTPVPEQLPDPRPEPTTVMPNNESSFVVDCAGEDKTLGELLKPIVENMVAQKIPYSQTPAEEWRDCSGNFLRLSSYLATRCANLGDDLAALPGIKDYNRNRSSNLGAGTAKARTTRHLARWYHDRGEFKPVFYDDASSVSDAPSDLETLRHLVRPGTVLWFAKRAPKRQAGVEPLFDLRSEGRIVHMATVTAVRIDEHTKLPTGFSMYHGRNQRHPGMVTHQHHWTWPRSFLRLDNDDPSDDKIYPPFGNWSQYLAGIAIIAPPKELVM